MLFHVEFASVDAPHHADECPGHCAQHPLLRGVLLDFHHAEKTGQTWGDIWYYEHLKELETETLDQKLARMNREAAAEARRKLELESEICRHGADLVATKAKMGLKRGQAVAKKPCPCKMLYSCKGDKSTGGAKPTTLHVSSECWAHEYTDPLTKKRIVKHACPWLHPGEEGWQKEWDTNRYFNPAATATENRFSALAGKHRRPQ